MKRHYSFLILVLSGLLIAGATARCGAENLPSGDAANKEAANKDAATTRPAKLGQFNPAHPSVDLFAAMKDGRLEVRVIPKDVTGGNVLITNKTDQPLNIKLPDSFAGVHVLAQIGGSLAQGMGQGMGGSMGGGGMGGGGMGGGGAGGGAGGNFFNVAPEKVGKVPYVSVCLEHGKPDPKSTMKYELRPLESFTTNPKVREVLVLLGQGAVTQQVAQIVAWHANNDMSWEALAAKRVELLNGESYSYFNAAEIRAAMQVDKRVTETLEAREKSSPAVPKL